MQSIKTKLEVNQLFEQTRAFKIIIIGNLDNLQEKKKVIRNAIGNFQEIYETVEVYKTENSALKNTIPYIYRMELPED